MAATTWSMKNLLGPIITRIIVYGTNPIDIERVIRVLETVKLINARVLENSWWNEWHKTAQIYMKIGKQAEDNKNLITAGKMYFLASSCYYAASLINYMSLEKKKQAYMKFMNTYKKCIEHYHTSIETIEILYNHNKSIPGYLHLPEGNGPFPCVLILTGAGTSKEETHYSARPLVERGIAAVTLDIPGTGESLFCRNIKFRIPDIKNVVSCTIDYLESRDDIINEKCGVYGICMGGTIAYKIAFLEERLKFCVTSFPLRFETLDPEKIPLWIKTGKWYDYFSGAVEEKKFLMELEIHDDEAVKCPYFLIHGKFDNWTSLENAMQLYNRAKGKKDKLIIEEEPAITGESTITHMMPVGEQYHWIKHIVADWVKKQVKMG